MIQSLGVYAKFSSEEFLDLKTFLLFFLKNEMFSVNKVGGLERRTTHYFPISEQHVFFAIRYFRHTTCLGKRILL